MPFPEFQKYRRALNAIGVLLETLTPAERAAFVLREVFDGDYADVARVLDSFGGDGGASDGGASGDGTAGDGAPIVGGLVKVRDRFGRVTSATTDRSV